MCDEKVVKELKKIETLIDKLVNIT
jgi:hypothetical protein